MVKPLIFVTNDDGINAPGIKALIEVMSEIGEVVVVAPDRPRSASGHAITIDTALRLTEIEQAGSVLRFSCSGTPVDCVKLGLGKVLDRKPDLLVSGINHGSNASINVIYSGTMAAAIEGQLEGINSIGFSLLDHDHTADFTASKEYAKRIALEVLSTGLPECVCLNVNIPKIRLSEIQGVRVCRQAHAAWKEDFQERIDPNGDAYYWLTGAFKNFDEGKDNDEWALKQNYISVVPIKVDLTAHNAIEKLKHFENI